MAKLGTLLAILATGILSTKGNPLDTNLAYRSPLVNYPEFGYNTEEIHARHARSYAKRQLGSANSFSDEHYPTFYGSDFSNAPFIWGGGVNFTHSVASGDALDTSVLLWTRAFPAQGNQSSSPLPDQSVPVCVRAEIATDEQMQHVVTSKTAYTSYDVDFTVKVEATHLTPDTHYFYQFVDCLNKGNASPIGKTRTFSSPNTPAIHVNNGKPIKIAVFSCSQFQAGWFNAYAVAAHNVTPDVFIHLGDYIYEGVGNGKPIGRQVLGRELTTLRDYRQRLNQYRTDESLQFAHQNYPWVTVWDDHEVANNGWKAGTSDSNDTDAGCAFSGTAGVCFSDRKLSAVRAYNEWMPVRQVDADDKFRIWRNFQNGKLYDLTMLDTRNYDRDVTDVGYNKLIHELRDNPQRSLMGPVQEKWFNDTLSESHNRGATWRLVGQQIVFTQVNNSGSFSGDNWNGYVSNRARVLDHLYEEKIPNTIILSGDSHKNWVSDLAHPNDTTTYDPDTGNGAIGVEFAGTAVTSDSKVTGKGIGVASTPAAADAASQKVVNAKGSEDLQWNEGSFRGFFTLTVSSKEVVADYYAMSNVSFSNLDGFVSATFHVEAGANKLSRPIAGGKVLAGVLKQVPFSGTGNATATSAISQNATITSSGSQNATSSAALSNETPA